MPECLLALGANLGNRSATLGDAVSLLESTSQVRIVRRSRWIETAPIGGPAGQGSFLNGAVLIQTSLSPEALLAAIERVESEHGRQRELRWGARTLDIDLLLYGQQQINRPELTVPHPRMAFRRFVLEPAAEIASDMLHPATGWTIGALFQHLCSAPPYAAIAGAPEVGKTLLAEEVARRTGAKFISRHHHEKACCGTSSEGATPAERIACEHAELLAQISRYAHEGWTISDFWLEQSLACAGLSAADEEAANLRSLVASKNRTVVQPKLLVVLTGPARELESQARSPSADYECQQLIEQYIMDHPPCPFLRVSGDDMRSAIVEVAAALDAMR